MSCSGLARRASKLSVEKRKEAAMQNINRICRHPRRRAK
jgi:hypothetical protein